MSYIHVMHNVTINNLLLVIVRHPTAADRPKFDTITKEQGQSPESLLKWTVRDKAAHLSATQLGAELEIGHKLYQDLQNTYLV